MSMGPAHEGHPLNLLRVPHYPHEDEKLRASALTRRRGGNGANTAQVLQLLLTAAGNRDVLPTLISVLPARDSAPSVMIRDSLPGVDCSHCIYREGCAEPASSYILRSKKTGSRTSVSHNELPEMTVDEFSAVADKLNGEACWYHFEGRNPSILHQCILYLRAQCPSVTISRYWHSLLPQSHRLNPEVRYQRSQSQLSGQPRVSCREIRNHNLAPV